MLFGRDKYEAFQDTSPFKHLLIRFLFNAMNTHETIPLSVITPDALSLLGVDSIYDPANFDEIRGKLNKLLESMPAEGSAPYIPVNEPVFLLRSADPLGPVLAEQWIATATKMGVSADRIKSATEQVERMKAWHEDTHPADL